MRKKISRLLNCIMVLILAASMLSGCTEAEKEIVLTTEFKEDEIMRINDISCYMPEMMLYLTNVKNQYESIYGEELWEKDLGDETLSERIKEMVLAKVAQVKVMNLMAADYGISLTDEEAEKVARAAEEYYSSLNDKEIELTGATLETVNRIYMEYLLAEKVYDYTIQDINPEISDDEARRITVQQILIRVYGYDSNGNRVDYTDKGREEAKELAYEIRDRATGTEEPEDFESLATEYNEDDAITVTFGRGEKESAYEEAAFDLDTDEISDVIETEKGYYVLKCISVNNVEETQENKVTILQERRDEAFEERYDAYVLTIRKNLNRELYDSITLIEDPEVTTKDLFEVDF